MFLILRQRRRRYGSFSSQCFSRSCRSILVFSWRFEFSSYRFVTCCCSIAAVELACSNWFWYFCTMFWNYDWIQTFIFSMSSLITEDLNSFSFLSFIVLKSSLLASLLSSWTAAADFLVAERLFGIIDKYIYIYKYKKCIWDSKKRAPSWYPTSYDKILSKQDLVNIYTGNIRQLIIEIFKCLKCISPPVMYDKKSEGSRLPVAKDHVLRTWNYSIQRTTIMTTATCDNTKKVAPKLASSKTWSWGKNLNDHVKFPKHTL